jgi:hypothetical protein
VRHGRSDADLLHSCHVLAGAVLGVSRDVVGPQTPPEGDSPEQVEHGAVLGDLRGGDQGVQDDAGLPPVDNDVGLVAEPPAAPQPRDGRRVGVEGVCSRLDQHVIYVAVAPVFSGLEGPDNWVSRVVEVFGCVRILRFIAATYVSANEAFPEMHPRVSGHEALLAALGGGDYAFSYLIDMRASLLPEHPN